ncbi:MAG: hypothetical protein HYX78_11695 [Armatimonadetes bacterium]|nr:hypothetical protein [Armatimonadota bacterium]
MKKLYPDAPDVPQGVANRGVRIIEKHLRLHRVERAKDLPEEAKVRLLRDLQAFFDSEMDEGGTKRGSSTGKRGFWSRLRERVENFLTFSAADSSAIVLCAPVSGAVCVASRR